METLHHQHSEIRFGDLTETGFDSILTEGAFAQSRKIILIDENVYDLWMDFFLTHFSGLSHAEIIQIPSGEDHKVLEICHHVWSALSEYEISRNDLIINIGGGVITDMGGFIAATFKRGLPFINIPTTLLAQVDASVGGKTGIDLGDFKNQIGVFADADFIFIDSRFLVTLPKIEVRSGFAEMLKHGLIADRDHWQSLIAINPSEVPQDLISLIQQSVKIKHNVVSQDPKEQGLRKILNFGHTIGHALESLALSLGNPLPHGYAVAHGMIAEAHISFQLDKITEADFLAIKNLLLSHYPPLSAALHKPEKLMSWMKNDKKNRLGNINFTLLSAIGKAVYDQHVEEGVILNAFHTIFSHENNA